MSDSLSIEHTSTTDGVVTIVCRGRITIQTGDAFRTTVKDLAVGQMRVLADVSEIDYVDSAGLGSVLAAYLSAKSANCDLKLIKVNPRVKDLLNITRLSNVLEERPKPT
jgi:anti-sigma B factor antagonist